MPSRTATAEAAEALRDALDEALDNPNADSLTAAIIRGYRFIQAAPARGGLDMLADAVRAAYAAHDASKD